MLAGAGCTIGPPLRLAEIAPPGDRTEIADVPLHAQEEHHCGPVSLLTILEASGVEADYARVVERVYVPGLEGSLQPEMLAAARTFRRIAYEVPPEPRAVLAELAAGRPVLVLLNLGVPSRPVWHYTVLVGYDVRRNRVLTGSPGPERGAQRAGAWLRRWDWAGRWAMVALSPGEWPAAPDRPRLLRALAAFEDTAPPDLAGRAWRAAVERWPDESLAWLGAGNAAYRLNDLETARNAFSRALALEPGSLAARLNLAEAVARQEGPCRGLEVLGAPPPAPDHTLGAAAAALRRRLSTACEDPGAGT